MDPFCLSGKAGKPSSLKRRLCHPNPGEDNLHGKGVTG
jgi:hypothetical protein